MGWRKRVMERGRPPEAAPYAVTPRGYPYPLRSWPPDAAVDIQNLAVAVDADATTRAGKMRAGNLAVPALGGVEAGSCTMLNATFSTPFVGALPIVVATLDWVPATTGLTVGYNNPAATPDQLNAFLHIGTISLAGPQFLVFFPIGNNISAGQLSINYLAYQI